jgi:hypothetical protein
VHIALSALTASGNYYEVVFLGQVPEQLAGVSIPHLGAHRHRKNEGFTIFASLLFAAAMITSGRFEVTLEMKIEEGLFDTCGFDYYITALAPVSTVRTAFGHVFFAPETDTTTAAVTGPDVDSDLVNKTHV